MKTSVTLFLLLPVLAFSQKIKVNTYDKFIKKQVVETSASTLQQNQANGVAISFKAVGNENFAVLKGYGAGASTISEGDELIFLLSNDSTVSAKSIGLQVFDVDVQKNRSSFNHEYKISRQGLELLSKYDAVGLRKYSIKGYTDIMIPKTLRGQARELTSLLLQELEDVKPEAVYVKAINLQDVQKHIGDSIMVCGKIFTTRFLPYSNNSPTLLNMGAAYPEQPLTVVIYGADRVNFKEEPEVYFKEKEVCVNGKIELYNNRPQIVVRKKEQLTLQEGQAKAF